jgi:hypothetical protein
MNEQVVVEKRPAPYAIGRLKSLQSIKYKPDFSKGFAPEFPVLTLPIEEVDVDLFRNKDARIGFGSALIEWGDVLVHCFCLQVEGTQVFWLADATDPEVWNAIDHWTRAKEVILQIEVQGQWSADQRSLFIRPPYLEDDSFAKPYRNNPAPQADVAWAHIMDAAECGFVILTARSGDTFVPLQRVYQCVLRTKRFERFVGDNVLIVGKTGADNLVAR